MSGLPAIFGTSEEKSQDSDKLLQLYWNRAELKKEFANLRKEVYRLQDQIKRKDGAIARVQQKLEHLEDLLIDPHWASNVVVFYQLRSLAQRCQGKLARFAEQLKQQREQKQQSDIIASWDAQRGQEAQALNQQLLVKQDEIHTLEDHLQSERHRLDSMSGLSKVFRRRSITAALDALEDQIEAARTEGDMLSESLAEIQGRKPPDTAGLDIPTKRSINLMILSFAQQMFLHFSDDDLAALAKEASEKSVGAINYGDQRECEMLLDRIRKRIDMMEQAADFAGVLQKRAKLISEKALFKNDSDTIPVSGTVATLYMIDDNDLVKEAELNILGENYWDIGNVLSR